MGFPRIAASTDVVFSVVCAQDTALSVPPFDFDSISTELPPQPKYIEADAQQWVESMTAWQKQKAKRIIDYYFTTEASKRLNTRSKSLDDINTEQAAIAVVQELFNTDTWNEYHKRGDESVFEQHPTDTPIRFRVSPLGERAKVKIVGQQATDPDKNVSAYEHVYNINVQVLRQTLRGITTWPASYPPITTEGGFMSEESIALIPHAYVSSLAGFMLDHAHLREPEKKA